jgi:predicted lactoylglutathione lyase
MNQFKQLVFVSLPVADLSRSTAFYQAIGFTIKMEFPDQGGIWMEWTDTFSVMLITHGKWKEFTPRLIPDAKTTAQFGLSLTRESRKAVDEFIERGAKAGGKSDPNPVEEYGSMYGRSIEDPDGHILEAKWMDMSTLP